VTIEDMRPEDWPACARIYEEGLDVGTFEEEVPSWEAWDATHLPAPRLVAREERRGGGNGHHESAADGIQERGQALLDYLRRTINMPAEIVTGEVEKRVGDMESLIDGALERALKRLNIPTRRDVIRLTARLDALEGRLGGAKASAVKRPTTLPRRPRVATAKARTRKGAA